MRGYLCFRQGWKGASADYSKLKLIYHTLGQQLPMNIDPSASLELLKQLISSYVAQMSRRSTSKLFDLYLLLLKSIDCLLKLAVPSYMDNSS